MRIVAKPRPAPRPKFRMPEPAPDPYRPEDWEEVDRLCDDGRWLDALARCRELVRAQPLPRYRRRHAARQRVLTRVARAFEEALLPRCYFIGI